MDHEFLSRYPDYVLFLKTFAGAGYNEAGILDDDFLFLSIYGFDRANYAFLESEYDVVDQRGFFGFCDLHYRYQPRPSEPKSISDGILTAQFCLDATEKRKRGVYVDYYLDSEGRLGETDCIWFCGSFSEWFDLLVTHRERIPAMEWVRKNPRGGL